VPESWCPENKIYENSEETFERNSVHCKEVLQQRREKRKRKRKEVGGREEEETGERRGEKRREEVGQRVHRSSTSGDRSSAKISSKKNVPFSNLMAPSSLGKATFLRPKLLLEKRIYFYFWKMISKNCETFSKKRPLLKLDGAIKFGESYVFETKASSKNIIWLRNRSIRRRY
jgi:hypothetical protein